MNHIRPNTRTCRWFLWICITIAAGVVLACGGGSGSFSSGDGDTCAVGFSVNWNREGTDPIAADFQRSALDDCVSIATVTASVFGSATGRKLRSGGPWACSDHEGFIRQVPAGGNGFVVVYGHDSSSGARFRGHSGDLALVADQTAVTNMIDAYNFVPELVAPADYSTISELYVDLSWHSVINAAGYLVTVSTAADLSNPVLAVTVEGQDNTSYTMNNLQPGHTYFWRVRAIDAQGTESAYDAIWRFGVTVQGNTPPTATINSPDDDAVFNPGISVIFNGIGSDVEDGELTGSALAWSSDIDGLLGYGNVAQSDQLSTGIHTITLNVTDSQGSSGSASIRIAIAQPASQDISGTWNYSAVAPWAEGDLGCQPGAVTSGTCHISQLGNQFTLEFLSGWVCSPSFACTYTGTVDGTHYVGSNTGVVDDQGGVVTNYIDFTVAGTDTLTGTSYSHYERPGYLCQWGYNLDMAPAPTPSNQLPIVQIYSPQSDSIYDMGQAIQFSGSATDPEDGPLTGEALTWTSSIDGLLGTGADFSYGNLSIGTHQVTLSAADSVGGEGSETITVIINSPPLVSISSPASNQHFAPGSSVSLVGSATDPEDGSIDSQYLRWSSNIDGLLGTGSPLQISSLSYGLHTISLRVTDSRGMIGSDSIELTINTLPNVTVYQPFNNAQFIPGSYVTLEAMSSDLEDGAIAPGKIVWTSSRDGQVATGSYTGTSGLSVGQHTITCTVSDSLNGSASASVNIVMNTPPSATIIQPAAGSMEMPGTPIACSGSWSDAEDTMLLTSNLRWSYQLLPSGSEVQFGTGTSASVTFSDFGTYRIRFRVTDNLGATTVVFVDFMSGG